MHAFEIPAAFPILWPYSRVLRTVENVGNVRCQFRKDDRILFSFHDRAAVVHEWFGDNSRFWVGFQEPDRSAEIDLWPLHQAFANHRGVFGETWVSNFFDPCSTNLPFEYLARPFVAEHQQLQFEWRKVSNRLWGGYTALICRSRQNKLVSASLYQSAIAVHSPSDDVDFEDFGRGLSDMDVAREAFAFFVQQLEAHGLLEMRSDSVA